MMIFTSGTSGNPKAVPFVHTMSVMCGLSLVAQMDITADDVCYLAMPLFHSNGVAVGFSVAITSGAAMVPVKFSVSRLVGDQVMAAVVLRQDQTLTPAEFEAFLAAQADLSPKAWPRFVRINDDLPQTATNKILKRELSAAGVTAGGGLLWERPPRSIGYRVVTSSREQT
uniref:AMP-binding protein n=1 Tax=Mycobacterium pinniadriaticum TaxID=2994102 RepID=UPI0038994200